MRSIAFFLVLLSAQLQAQTTQNLVTWMNFDNPDCEAVDEFGDPGINTLADGDTACLCGVRDQARYFDGMGDRFFVFGTKIDQTFSTVDFTLSFYFKPLTPSNSPEAQVLFSKKEDCNSDSSFAVKYIPFNRQIAVELTENMVVGGSLTASLPFSCWYHIAVVRKGANTILYVNGLEVDNSRAPGNQRVNISNSQPLTVGSSDCGLDAQFNGLIDEIRLYNKALSRDDIEDLYIFPDHISTGLTLNGSKDTTIFLGESVRLKLTPTCATDFLWSPSTNVDDVNSPSPLVTPTETTTYMVSLEDSLICTATDTVRVIVVDPSSIDCSDIFLPTAFTPNGDGLNDRYGISNPFSTGELLSFEIFDRWGNIVFSTTDVLDKWDGSYKGTPVNPGVFLYRVQFRCEGKEDFLSGSVTVIR